MLTLHHLNNSRSQRVLWLLEELELPFEIKFYKRNPKTMLAPPELKRVHPLGKSPLLTDGDEVVAESAVIIDYVLDQYGQARLRPAAGTPARRLYNFWMHYAEGSLMPPLLVALVVGKIEKAPLPFFLKPITKGIGSQVRTSYIEPQLKGHLDFMESELGKHEWFSGAEFTAADIMLSFPIEVAETRAGLGAARPRLTNYLQRIHARPAYQRALKKGGPFSLEF